MKEEDLQTRRDYFKKTVGNILPFLGVMVLGTSFFSACTPDGGGSSGCGKSCSGSCEGDCAGDCDDGCWTACIAACVHYQR